MNSSVGQTEFTWGLDVAPQVGISEYSMSEKQFLCWSKTLNRKKGKIFQ